MISDDLCILGVTPVIFCEYDDSTRIRNNPPCLSLTPEKERSRPGASLLHTQRPGVPSRQRGVG